MATNSNFMFQPRPWTWTCHKCRRRNPMACTQRCIECGHKICYSERATTLHHCNVQFDFRGWQTIYNLRLITSFQHNSPTEEGPVFAAEEETPRQLERNRLRKMLNGTSSCFTDCRLPSECFITMALNGITNPASQPSSSSQPTSERSLKAPKKPTKYKRQRRKNFQKVPSPLSQVWHIDDVLDEEVGDSAVIFEREGGEGGEDKVGEAEIMRIREE